MIAVIDYGVGNLFSLRSSLRRLGLDAAVTADPARRRAAARLNRPRGGAVGAPRGQHPAPAGEPEPRDRARRSRGGRTSAATQCAQPEHEPDDREHRTERRHAHEREDARVPLVVLRRAQNVHRDEHREPHGDEPQHHVEGGAADGPVSLARRLRGAHRSARCATQERCSPA